MTKLALDRILPLIAGAFALAIFFSVIIVFTTIFSSDFSLLEHFFTYLFPRYIKDTAILTFSVCVLSALIGSSLAFLVANFSFFGSKLLNVLLVLPLAIPAYILAFIYVGILEFDGIFIQIFGFRVDVFNIKGAILVLTLSLYPYVYLFARASFLTEAKPIFDISKVLGLSRFQTFYRISIFIARPAIFSGLMLVLMETLSDYGTAAYFGVDTFSAGIFRLWFDLRDIGSASILSSFLIVLIFFIMVLEYRFAKRKNYSLRTDTSATMPKIKLGRLSSFFAFLYCFSVAFLGFLLPFGWLLYWGLKSSNLNSPAFFELAYNSLKVALISAVVITVIAFLLNFSSRLSKSETLKTIILKCSSVGYAMPGAVIGVSLMIVFMHISRIFNIQLLSASLSVLIMGYTIRYLATSVLSFESGYHKIHKSIDEASRVLSLSTLRLGLRIHAPLLKHFFVLSFIVVFVDVVKELPLSLILRPFDFETLSIRAFFYATDERIYEAALPALLIVVLSLMALLYIEFNKREKA